MEAPRTPQSEQELRDQLEAVLRGAESNDVEVEGGYPLRSRDGQTDYEVQVVRLAEEARAARE